MKWMQGLLKKALLFAIFCSHFAPSWAVKIQSMQTDEIHSLTCSFSAHQKKHFSFHSIFEFTSALLRQSFFTTKQMKGRNRTGIHSERGREEGGKEGTSKPWIQPQRLLTWIRNLCKSLSYTDSKHLGFILLESRASNSGTISA